MPKDPTKTFVPTTGWEVYTGAVNETFPVADVAIDTGDWTSLGVVQDDPTLGISIEKSILTASNVTGPVRETLVGRTFAWQFDNAQWTKATIEDYFGGGAWTTSGGGELWTAGALAAVEKALVWEGTDNASGLIVRIMHKRVSITPNGDISFGPGALAKMPVSVTALAPASGADIYISASDALSAA